MRLYVVSDLHVRGPLDPVYAALLRLLEDRPRPGDVLVLAGDIFDVFVGNKKVFRDRYALFLEALRRASERGVAVHYIEGNHDFLLRGVLGAIPGVTLHAQEVRLELAGRRFFIAHGDTADSKDRGYRLLRFFLRSPLMRGAVAAAPGAWLDRLGRGASRISRGAPPLLAAQLPSERFGALRNRYRSFAAERLAEGYDFVVLGHCHDLDEMKFKLGDRRGQYMNVGFPPVHGSCVRWDSDSEWLERERFG